MPFSSHIGADAASSRAIVIRVNDPLSLVARESSLAALAARFAPDTVEAEVFAKMREKIMEALAKEQVNASVDVVRALPATAQAQVGGELRALAVGGVAGALLTLAIRALLGRK